MNSRNNVAVYWDFENIHISLCSLAMGEYWYKNNMFTKQPALINVKDIMDYVSGIGEVNINKAYANWSFFHAYSYDLQNYSIDLIQMYPRGKHGKNGSDIRIAIDILDDCTQQPHLDCIVLVSGDSDYISIAQKVRQKGKRIIGIGVQETTNQYWIKACNEFKFYSSLSKMEDIVENDFNEDFDIDDAKKLLVKSLKMVFSESGNDYALRVSIKPIMLRLDPSFDESNYNCSNFTDFLNRCSDIIQVKESDKDILVMLRENLPGAEDPGIKSTHRYERTLKKQQIRLVKPKILRQGIKETFYLFQQEPPVQSYNDYRDRLLARLKRTIPDIQDSDTAKIKALIYKAFCFNIDFENKRVLLSGDIQNSADLEERIHRMIIKRILDNVDNDESVDAEYISRILFGDTRHTTEIYELIAEYNRRTMGSS
jgi:uncharacterized LabA/DUF88 family protein